MSGTVLALSAATRFVEEDGLELTIYALGDSEPLACRVFGNAESLFDSNGSRPRARSVSFGRNTFGFGLGSLGGAGHLVATQATAATRKADGAVADAAENRYGEFLAVAGAVAQSAHKSHGLPDYLLAAGDFVPAAEVVYGAQCEGEFPVLIRFSPKETDRQFGLVENHFQRAAADERSSRGIRDSGRLCRAGRRPVATVTGWLTAGWQRSLQLARPATVAVI